MYVIFEQHLRLQDVLYLFKIVTVQISEESRCWFFFISCCSQKFSKKNRRKKIRFYYYYYYYYVIKSSRLKRQQNLGCLPGIFVLVLASIKTWIRGFVRNNKNDPFSDLFLLENADLLWHLKALITAEPTKDMPRPTRIPTHIDLQITTMEEMLLSNNKFLEKLEKKSTIIQEKREWYCHVENCYHANSSQTTTINQLLSSSNQIAQKIQMIVVLLMMVVMQQKVATVNCCLWRCPKKAQKSVRVLL